MPDHKTKLNEKYMTLIPALNVAKLDRVYPMHSLVTGTGGTMYLIIDIIFS